jgi:hypothetical protein
MLIHSPAEFIVAYPQYVAERHAMNFMFDGADSDEYNGCHCTSNIAFLGQLAVS